MTAAEKKAAAAKAKAEAAEAERIAKEAAAKANAANAELPPVKVRVLASGGIHEADGFHPKGKIIEVTEARAAALGDSVEAAE